MTRERGNLLSRIEDLSAARPQRSLAPGDIPRPPVRRTRRYLALVVVGVAVATGVWGLRHLGAAAPVVERAGVWMDTVKRGPMVRDVVGQGSLVAEEVRWISAKVTGRVDRVLVKPGTLVQPETVIMYLVNPELQLEALEADRQVAEGQAQLVNLEATLTGQKLAQQSLIASLRSETADADRRAHADEELAKKGFLSDLELGQTRGRAAELHGRLRFETQRDTTQSRGTAAQIQAQRAQIDRLRSIAEFRHKAVDDLGLRAGIAGVLQALSVQPGQTVTTGALLAKVVDPAHLRAEIKVVETQAKDVQVGQKASIDTHTGLLTGRVTRIDPAAQAGTVTVDLSIEGQLPPGARPDLNVEGIIEIERLPDALFVNRPALAQPNATVGLFKVDPEGSGASRIPVRLGGASVKNVEILNGLEQGDRVILSDMSQWDHVDRIRLR